MKNVRIIFIALLVIVLSFFSINKFLKKEVTIIDDERVIKVRTFRKTLSSLLDEYSFDIGPYDKLSISKESKIKDDMIIKINRAFPIKIVVDNKVKDTKSTNILVKNLLKRENIKLGKLDRVYPDINSYVSKNNVIKIMRIQEKELTETVDVPFQTIIKLRPELDSGQIKTESKGVVGKKKVKYKVIIKDGIEISRSIIDTEIINEGRDEVIYKGFDKLFVTSRGMPFKYKEIMTLEATAYDLSYQSTGKNKDHPEYGITYSGTRAHPGVVAVDKDIIPLGSKLYIESLDSTRDYGFASAEDTGSAIKGKRIDLFISDHDRAMKYGRRNVRVYVLDDEVSDESLEGYSERRIYERN